MTMNRRPMWANTGRGVPPMQPAIPNPNAAVSKVKQRDRYGNEVEITYDTKASPQPGADSTFQMLSGFGLTGNDPMVPASNPDLDDPTNRDSVHAMLTPGEFVLNKEATEMYGPVVEQMNNHGLRERHRGNVEHVNRGGGITPMRNSGGPIYRNEGGGSWWNPLSWGSGQEDPEEARRRAEAQARRDAANQQAAQYAAQQQANTGPTGVARENTPPPVVAQPDPLPAIDLTPSPTGSDEWLMSNSSQAKETSEDTLLDVERRKQLAERANLPVPEVSMNQPPASMQTTRPQPTVPPVDQLRSSAQPATGQQAQPARYDAFSGPGWEIYKDTVGKIESNNKYNIQGGYNDHYDGRWQMGAAAKKDAARILGIPMPSREDFRRDPQLQDKMFKAYTQMNHKVLMNNSKAYRNMTPQQQQQILGYAHNQGAGGAIDYLRTGRSKEDGFGTNATKYSKALMAAQGNADSYQQAVDASAAGSGTRADALALQQGHQNTTRSTPVPQGQESIAALTARIMGMEPDAQEAALNALPPEVQDAVYAHEEQVWRTNEELRVAQMQGAVTSPDAPGAQFVQDRIDALTQQADSLGVPPMEQGVGVPVYVGGAEGAPMVGQTPEGLPVADAEGKPQMGGPAVPLVDDRPAEDIEAADVGAVPGVNQEEAAVVREEGQEVLDEQPLPDHIKAENFRAAEEHIASMTGIRTDGLTPEQVAETEAQVNEALGASGHKELADSMEGTGIANVGGKGADPKKVKELIEQADGAGGDGAGAGGFGAVKGMLADIFKDMFGTNDFRKILMRGLVMYAGARLTGMSGQQALAFAAKDGLLQGDRARENEEKQMAKIDSRKKEAAGLVKDYTKESVKEYMDSGDPLALVPKVVEGEGGGQVKLGKETDVLWVDGVGKVPVYSSEKGQGAYVQVPVHDENGNITGTQQIPLATFRLNYPQAVDYDKDKHDRETVGDNFANDADKIVKSHAGRLGEGQTMGISGPVLGVEAEELYFDYIDQGRFGDNTSTLRKNINLAMDDYAKAAARHASNPDKFKKPGSLETFVEKRLFVIETGLGYNNVENTDAENVKTVQGLVKNNLAADGILQSDERFAGNYKEDWKDLNKLWKMVEGSPEGKVWNKEREGWDPKMFYFEALLDPNHPNHNEALKTYNRITKK